MFVLDRGDEFALAGQRTHPVEVAREHPVAVQRRHLRANALVDRSGNGRQFLDGALVIYGLMLGFLLVLTLYGVLSLRSRLLEIREYNTEKMREQFKAVELNYWRKLDRNESPEPEATHIETMNTMFERLQSMALWPISLSGFTKLAATTLGSLAITVIESWITSGKTPAAVSWLPF